MLIVKATPLYGFDFAAVLQCEFCGHSEETNGYNDHNYHHNVVPDKKCGHCGKSSNDDGRVTLESVEKDVQLFYSVNEALEEARIGRLLLDSHFAPRLSEYPEWMQQQIQAASE